MLNNLHVKNLALIDEADVTFGRGLNILTGETGAGKSLIIESLCLAMGARADLNVIRQGESSGLVEVSLIPDDKEVLKLLDDMGIDHEDQEIIIRRKISETGSDCRINGQKVTLKELAGLTVNLIDICGQRDSISLLKNNSLRLLLDSSGSKELLEALKNIETEYAEYRSVLCKLKEIDTDESIRKRNADLAEYEVNEIDEADLKPGEDEAAEGRFHRLSNITKINETLSRVFNLINSENGARMLSGEALRSIKEITEYDNRLEAFERQLIDIDSLLGDLNHDISSYIDTLEYDPEEYMRLSERLDTINRLKGKYGSTIEEILKYRDAKAAELEVLRNHDEYINGLSAQRDSLHDSLMKLCETAHKLRAEAADKLEKKLLDELKCMNFLDCSLRIKVDADPEHITSSGYDSIDFLISMNPGESLKPLNQVASGGELSRIMLAIKSVTGDKDDIDTLIFDEIDTGISGQTSMMVGRKLHALAGAHQVICITHQPQVAACADTHFVISKEVRDNRTYTEVKALDEDGMIAELVRMSGADPGSQAARSVAEELKRGS